MHRSAAASPSGPESPGTTAAGTIGAAPGGTGTEAGAPGGEGRAARVEGRGAKDEDASLAPRPSTIAPPPEADSWVATTKQDHAPAPGSAQQGSPGAPGVGDSGRSGIGGLPIEPRTLAEKTPRPGLPIYTRLTGGRDWIITIECLTDGVVLRSAGQRFGVESLGTGSDGENALSRALREMIARRQASVRPGEMPYRPQIRFLVKPPDGLRSYYAAYPALEGLRLTMTRENFDPVDESKLPPLRKE